jgi:NAD-dependent SIR2 family protein deacetylase
MSVFLAGSKHARCVQCSAVVHFPWGEASDHQMALLGWSMRLQQGCNDCGGRLLKLSIDCPECREYLIEEKLWA